MEIGRKILKLSRFLTSTYIEIPIFIILSFSVILEVMDSINRIKLCPRYAN